MSIESRHLSEWIDRPAEEVYAYASKPENMPEWAPGLGSSMENEDGQWFVDSPDGRLAVMFTPQNDFGILDHHVTMPSGEVVYNPLRIIAAPRGCEVLFSLRRRPEMTDPEFDADRAAVAADLTRLKTLMEAR